MNLSEPTDLPEPPLNGPTKNLQALSDAARIEQLTEQCEELLEANGQLQTELALGRQELAAVSPLLLRYGQGVLRVIVNARSIQALSLQEQTEIDPHGLSRSLGKYAVLVDSRRVTDYLPPQEAESALAKAEADWAVALEPPQTR